MTLKYLLGLAGGALLIGAIVWSLQKPVRSPEMIVAERIADRQRIELHIAELSPLTVEVVNTPASTAQGLSGRDSIGADGMLFLLSDGRVPTFWMKDMKFDLDLVWIDRGKIVEITPNVPHPQSGVTHLPTYSPQIPANWVLELPAGDAARRSLQVGQTVQIFP